jgi:GntR family transcriptional regulator/MocR family aminotransferase
MRELYGSRLAVLRGGVRKLSGMLELATESAGLEIVGWLPAEINDRAAVATAAQHGVEVRAVSQYAVKRPAPSGLVLGFAAVNATEIDTGLGQLAAALREVMERHP